MTILVRTTLECDCCGQGGALDNKKIGANAAKWRRAVNVSQKSVAVNGMDIKQSFYSALELGQRTWTPALIKKFEKVIIPLIEQRKIDVRTL